MRDVIGRMRCGMRDVVCGMGYAGWGMRDVVCGMNHLPEITPAGLPFLGPPPPIHEGR